MSVALAAEPERPADPFSGWLDDVLAGLADGIESCADLHDGGAESDAVRIDRLARLEKLKAAASALQAAESVRFAQSQVEQQMASGVDPRVIGRGVADQIGLACKVSPVEGSRRLNMARALWFDLPQTFQLLADGEISELVASLVVSETRHLDRPSRRAVDGQIVAAGISQMGPRNAAACARRHAYRADPKGFVERGRTRTQPSPGRAAAGTRHHGGVDRLSAGRAGGGLPGGLKTAHGHRARPG